MRTLSDSLQTAEAASERTALARLTIRDLRLKFDTEYDGALPVNKNPALGWGDALMGDSFKDSDGHIHQAIVRETGGQLYVYYREVTNLADWSGTWTQITGT